MWYFAKKGRHHHHHMGQKRRGVILVDTGLKINKLENKNTKYVVNKFTRTITSQTTNNQQTSAEEEHRSEKKKHQIKSSRWSP